MSKVAGVVTGVVTAVKDPDQQGRVQLSFPFLGGQNQSTWAPVATLMAGGGRGSWFMPEVGDEVLVAFDHGDFDHPFVVGFLWNGQDQPPASDITPSVRRLQTVSGHKVDFDDRDGSQKITIKTQGGHTIEMNDVAGSESITITTSGNQQIQMQDTPATITIQTAMQNQVIVSDAPPGVTIQAPSGIVTVSCAMANITADATLNVSAPITIFDGVVQAQTLIADAVVGAAYTPAPGNTFGL
jgi:phage baseplate assembly protein V